jgi:hypothetical protein
MPVYPGALPDTFFPVNPVVRNSSRIPRFAISTLSFLSAATLPDGTNFDWFEGHFRVPVIHPKYSKPAGSSINTRRLARSYFLEPRSG